MKQLLDKCFQSRRILVCLIMIIAWFATQSQEYIRKGPPPKMKVLIVKGNSGLEYNVMLIVKEWLVQTGYHVDVDKTNKLDDQKLELYDLVLVMHAVKRGTLSRQVQQAISTMSEGENEVQPYIFIATINGEEWSEEKSMVDAVSGASDKVPAQKVAEKIISRFQMMLVEKKTE